MSSLTNNVIVTLLFNDASTRNIVFEGVADEDLAFVKAKIQSINANSNGEYENFYKTFISDDGAAIVKIEACKIVSTMEEVVYGD